MKETIKEKPKPEINIVKEIQDNTKEVIKKNRHIG